MSLENRQFSHRLNTFEFEGRHERVSFVETTKVVPGVECDVYRFDQDAGKDLGVIRIQPGGRTPLQRVLAGERTIEGYISGRGRLVIERPDSSRTEYRVGDQTSRSLSVDVAIGERMQWQADIDSPLVAYEICLPPYQDGRFENLPGQA